MLEKTEALTLKRAAELLGVHEQTLRSWEHNGIIRMIRLPGSGYRRVPAAEVTRLQHEMQADKTQSTAWIAQPDESPEAIQRGEAMAAAIRAELAYLEEETTFDEFLADRRGRA
ncbi:MAG: excisionase family DNA-binding protein [Caldilinea sp.]